MFMVCMVDTGQGCGIERDKKYINYVQRGVELHIMHIVTICFLHIVVQKKKHTFKSSSCPIFVSYMRASWKISTSVC